jgi:hypothetical protein
MSANEKLQIDEEFLLQDDQLGLQFPYGEYNNYFPEV